MWRYAPSGQVMAWSTLSASAPRGGSVDPTWPADAGQNVAMTTSISVSRPIAAPPDQVWALIADLTRMAEWSPENTGGTWVKGASGPAVGAHFKGTNVNGSHKWSTAVVVTTCEPGQAFAFRVTALGLGVALWSFTFEPSDAGCIVTETWTDERGRIAKLLGGPASGVADREAHNRAGMETTLANLAAGAEA
jgi:uncharacterized protein YndB with AHSA1/START domain